MPADQHERGPIVNGSPVARLHDRPAPHARDVDERVIAYHGNPAITAAAQAST